MAVPLTAFGSPLAHRPDLGNSYMVFVRGGKGTKKRPHTRFSILRGACSGLRYRDQVAKPASSMTCELHGAMKVKLA